MSTWVFGYGSLIWNPGFDFEEKSLARFVGWRRRFWQGSEDHRGMPGAPGRVVTLVPGDSCEGIAFRLPQQQQVNILSMLDVREKGGYERVIAPLHLADGRTVEGITYLASTENPLCNREYLLELASAFREYKIADEHVFELEKMLLGEEYSK